MKDSLNVNEAFMCRDNTTREYKFEYICTMCGYEFGSDDPNMADENGNILCPSCWEGIAEGE